VIRRELAEYPGALQQLNIDSSSLELNLDASMPPHCLVCAATSNVEICSACNATAWCLKHKGTSQLVLHRNCGLREPPYDVIRGSVLQHELRAMHAIPAGLYSCMQVLTGP
jgi:hypothetical protein